MNTRSGRCTWLGCVAVIAAFVMVTASTAMAQTESILQKVLRTHVLTVGTISGNPPWEFTTPDGQLDGYDIGIAKAIAADLGAKVQFVQTSGAGRIPALQTHKVDCVIAELDYTPLRAQTVAYTRAYANPASQFIVQANAPYHTLASLNDPNVTLGYALGGDEANIWPKLLPKAKLKAFTTVADAEQALVSGEITATGEPSVLNVQMMKTHPGVLRVIDPPYLTAITGIGVPQGDFQWWMWLDQWVENFNFTGANQAMWVKYVGGGTPLVTPQQ